MRSMAFRTFKIGGNVSKAFQRSFGKFHGSQVSFRGGDFRGVLETLLRFREISKAF